MPSITDWNIHNLLKLVNQNFRKKFLGGSLVGGIINNGGLTRLKEFEKALWA
jgi:hypothetical protein